MGALTTWAASSLCSGLWASDASSLPQNGSGRNFRLLRQEVLHFLSRRPVFVVRVDGPRRLWGDAKLAKLMVDVDFQLSASIWSVRLYLSDHWDAHWLVSPGDWADTLLTSFIETAQNCSSSFSDLLLAFWSHFQSAPMALQNIRAGNGYAARALHRVAWT